MRIYFLFALGLLMGGCIGGGATLRDAADGVYRDLQGGSLELRQRLWVKASHARVFLQHGKVVGRVDFYAPQCAFEIDSVAHQGVAIAPDTFHIERVQRVMTEVVQARGLQFAALARAGLDDDGISQSFEGYHFWLSSPQQPQVMRMSCYGVHAEPPDLWPPTLQEIRRTLGDIAHIRMAH